MNGRGVANLVKHECIGISKISKICKKSKKPKIKNLPATFCRSLRIQYLCQVSEDVKRKWQRGSDFS